jgi:ribose 5-phosphate isomerase B
MSRINLIPIAADHAGVDLKQSIQRLLANYRWDDLGPKGHDRVDYPDYAEAVARKIAKGEASYGILICGSGIGMCMAANKIPGVRAAVVDNPVAARLSREHNDANVLCLGSRFLAPEYAAEIVRTWLETEFSEDPRHLKRVQKITALETTAISAPAEAPASRPASSSAPAPSISVGGVTATPKANAEPTPEAAPEAPAASAAPATVQASPKQAPPKEEAPKPQPGKGPSISFKK